MAEEQLNNLAINDDDDVVDPWNVAGKSETGIDYDKLISKLTKNSFAKVYLANEYFTVLLSMCPALLVVRNLRDVNDETCLLIS